MRTKAEAAEFLGVSTRAIERYVTAGRLVPKYRSGPTGKLAVFEDEDLDRLKREREEPQAETIKPTQALVRRPSSGVVMRRGSPDVGGPGIEDLGLMVCLTVEQAARLAGLGTSVIERAIADGALVAHPYGPHGSRVLLREHIENFARALFDPKVKRRR